MTRFNAAGEVEVYYVEDQGRRNEREVAFSFRDFMAEAKKAKTQDELRAALTALAEKRSR